MERYHLGQKVGIGDTDAASKRLEAAYRVEATRPDESIVNRDWEGHLLQLKADQLGLWSWRMYVREAGLTTLETGQFEVTPPSVTERSSGPLRRRLGLAVRRLSVRVASIAREH